MLYAVISFFCGSLPFSYWIGTLFVKSDIRTLGDGNPGASNVFKTGNRLLGTVAILLDYGKGFIPVLLLRDRLDVNSLAWIAMAIGPVVGHAFSPFLLFRGGKSVTVTFGIWSGLTLWIGPVTLGASLIVNRLLIRCNDGWSVMLGLATIMIPLFLTRAPLPYWIVLAANASIVGYKHREDLIKPLLIPSGR